MRRLPQIIMLMALAVASAMLMAQRRITPVTPPPVAGRETQSPTDTAEAFDPSRLVQFHDASGNVVLVDTVTGMEVRDTTAVTGDSLPKMEYPLWHAVSVGVDLWDPVMRAFGQHYGLVGFSAGVNLHNRYRPMVEVGLGDASYTPEEGNFTYKGKMAPYFKIGMDYNFLYNSNPDYEMFAGVRFGFSPFSYEITDVTVNAPYWGETGGFDIPSQSVTASYFEFLVGIKVKVWRGISLGWTLKYHSVMNDGKPSYGKPWYIPGFGTRGSTWAGGFSIYYTIPLNKRRRPAVEDLGADPPIAGESDAPVETAEQQ